MPLNYCIKSRILLAIILISLGFALPLNAQTDQLPPMPMTAVWENTLDASWQAKDVLASRVLDDMEDIATWSHSGRGRIELTGERTQDGGKSLRLYFPGKRPDSSGAWPTAGIGQKFNGENWNDFNRISIWVYPELKNAQYVTLAIMIANDGEKKIPDVYQRLGRHDIILEPGKWNHVVWEIPDLPRDKVTSLSFVHIIAGKERGGIADEGYLDFDRLALEKVDADHYEGWGVAAGKIAFSHSGYLPGARKTAAAGDINASIFSVINIETGRTVLEKDIKNVSSYIGAFRQLDFSEIEEEGTYILKAGDIYSRPFRIAHDAWNESIWKNINYWYCQRCGQTVPGVHDICHRDVYSELDGKRIVVNGGWHDAGDLTQMIYNTGPAVIAMFSLAERVRDTDKIMYERLIEEGKWGLEWMLKVRFGNGYRQNFGGVNRWTDGIIGTDDDISFKAANRPFENMVSASTISHAALALKDSDPVLSDNCLRAAEEDWQAAVDKMMKLDVEICGEAVITSMNLYELTGEERYSRKAIEFADVLMQSQEQKYPDWKIPLTGFFYRDPEKLQVLRYNPIAQDQAPLMALDKLCRAFPTHEKWMEWYAALALHAEYLKKVSEFTMPYGMFPQSIYHMDEEHKRSTYGLQQSTLAGGERYNAFQLQVMNGMELGNGYYLRFFPVWYGHRGNFGIQLAQAKALAVASHLRNDPAGINLSRVQLEWIVGKNPFCQSTMWGEGYDFSALYTPSSGHIVGALPVGIQTLENKDIPYWPAAILYNYKETWSNPAARWLWLMEDVALPAQVTVKTGDGKAEKVAFIERKTGIKHEVRIDAPSGIFEGTLPEGEYTVICGNVCRSLTLLPGNAAVVDFTDAFSFGVSQMESGPGEFRIDVMAEGDSEAEFELRGWNIEMKDVLRRVELKQGRIARLIYDVKVSDPGKPWIAVVIPNGNMNAMKEVHGIK